MKLVLVALALSTTLACASSPRLGGGSPSVSSVRVADAPCVGRRLHGGALSSPGADGQRYVRGCVEGASTIKNVPVAPRPAPVVARAPTTPIPSSRFKADAPPSRARTSKVDRVRERVMARSHVSARP